MGLFIICLLSLCLGIEVLFVSILISLFFPQHVDPLAMQLFDVYRKNIIPERDVLFYRLFIVFVGGVFAALMFLLKRKGSPGLLRGLKQFVGCEVLVVVAQVFCAFKFLLYHQPIWLALYYVCLGVSVLSKIFWPEIRRFIDRMEVCLKDDERCRRAGVWVKWLFIPVIFIIVWVPDYEAAVARMFMGEQFHHMDWFLTSAGWAHTAGNVLGIDSISRYGIGAPVLVSEIARSVLGGFNYENALLVMMALAVVYYVIWYFVFRCFFGQTMLAVIGVLAGMRLQLFHLETFPFIFTYPQTTPLRFFFDAVLFGLLLWHIRRPLLISLIAAAVSAGVAVYNVTGEGLYLLAAFYAFLIAREIYALKAKDPGLLPLSLESRAMLAALPWVVMFSCVWLTVGKFAFTNEFWNNQLEYIRFYKVGHGSVPLMNNLVPGMVLEAGMAFVLPALYVLSLIGLIGLMIERKVGRRGLIVITAIVYLLAAYHYHAMVSNNTTAYLRIGIVIAFLGCFWVAFLLNRLQAYYRRLALLGIFGVVLVSIATNHLFLLYPNILNLSRNPMTHPVVSQAPMGRAGYFNHLFISYPDAFKLPANSLGEKEELLLTENDFQNDRQNQINPLGHHIPQL